MKLRCKKGKEDPTRIKERRGLASYARPENSVIWVHAASVGEAQSALIVIDRLVNEYPDASFLVTTGTVTSSSIMQGRLPEQAIHQFFPLDQPHWVKAFIEHWAPDCVLWLESELWPNMLHEIKEKDIPCILLNARLSDKSYKLWSKATVMVKELLSTFDIILCQTAIDQQRYKDLGAPKTLVTDNLKYSASLLKCDPDDFEKMTKSLNGRPVWVCASTHEPEEQMAARIHQTIKKDIPELLTIVVPRHPERRDEITQAIKPITKGFTIRGDEKTLPREKDEVYIADTLGELGLFYKLAPIAFIGRSLSHDGGGGHNPIEAAQLGCAIIHGPLTQNLQEIYAEMCSCDASLMIENETELCKTLRELFSNNVKTKKLQKAAKSYAQAKNKVVDVVMKEIMKIIEKHNLNNSTKAV